MQDFAPSEDFIKKLVIIVISIGVFYFVYRMAPLVWQKIESWKQKSQTEEIAYSRDALALRSRDTDHDGLLDWEESLIGTDPTKADSDSDGVSDFVQHQDDISRGQTEIGESETGSGNVNFTEALGRDLYTSLSITAQQQGEVTAEQQEQLATVALNGIQSIKPRTYAASDIRSIPNSSGAQQQFKAQILSALKKYPIDVSDVPRMLNALENDQSIPETMITKAISQTSIISELLLIPVPEQYVQRYLQYINAVSTYTFAVAAMAQSDLDPAPAIIAVQNIKDTINNLANSMSALPEIFPR